MLGGEAEQSHHGAAQRSGSRREPDGLLNGAEEWLALRQRCSLAKMCRQQAVVVPVSGMLGVGGVTKGSVRQPRLGRFRQGVLDLHELAVIRADRVPNRDEVREARELAG